MGKLPLRSDGSWRAMPGKKDERIIMDEQFFFELFGQRFCCKAVQRTAGDSCGKTVAGKNTVIDFK